MMPLLRRCSLRLQIVVLTCLLIPMMGCGGGSEDGPARYEAHGSVTFNGQPVPYGEIVFEPDSTKGNEGPAARAEIQNGTYTTSSSQGVVAGPQRVRISGYDGNPPPGGGTQPHGQPLFSEHIDSIDQPKESATHDFEIKGS